MTSNLAKSTSAIYSGNKDTSSTAIFLTTASPACDIYNAFFSAMDLDGNGYLREQEVLKIGTMGFDESITRANERWERMLTTMDDNHDKRISRAEFVGWMEKEHASKVQENGTFVPSHAEFLLRRLEVLKEHLRGV